MKSPKFTRRNFIKWSIRGGFCSAIAYPTLVEPDWPVLKNVEISIKDLPKSLDNFKIGLLADFHRGLFVSDRDIEHVVEMMQKAKPDIICLVGDFVNGEAEYIEPLARVLSRLDAPMGVFAVLGNHDYWTDPKKIQSVLEQYKIPVLINRAVEIKTKVDSFFLAGLDDAWEGRPDCQKTLRNIPQNKMVLLIVHEPDYADAIARSNKWIPLQLSGHSHGGQVVIPFLGAPILPYMAKKYPAGLYRVDKARFVYTSRGVGTVVPFRLNCRPEVNLLTLHRSKGST